MSGLGLSIVRAIVRAHGGTVSLDSEPDKGSTFTIRIPSSNGQATHPVEATRDAT